jgi:hypothetical protein
MATYELKKFFGGQVPAKLVAANVRAIKLPLRGKYGVEANTVLLGADLPKGSIIRADLSSIYNRGTVKITAVSVGTVGNATRFSAALAAGVAGGAKGALTNTAANLEPVTEADNAAGIALFFTGDTGADTAGIDVDVVIPYVDANQPG